MRKKLSRDEGIRKRFRAVLSRLGKKVNFKGYSEETILLVNIVDAQSGVLVTDHIWFSYSKVFQAIPFAEGTVVEFDARVRAYTKGYVNKRVGVNRAKTDFRLSHPTRLKVIS